MQQLQLRELIVSADVGHANCNVIAGAIGDLRGSRLPLAQSVITVFDAPEENTFTLISGHAQWEGRTWARTGQTIANLIPTSDMGKVAHLLPLLISSIWDMTQDGDIIHYVGSVHLPSWQEDMKNAVSGEQVVLRNGVTKKLTIKPFKVACEGAGAIARHLITKKTKASTSLVLDIGGGTTILSPFQGYKIIPGSSPMTIPGSGIRQLIIELGNDSQLIRGLGADQFLNYFGLERSVRGDRIFRYGNTEINITPYLEEKVDRWFKDMWVQYKVSMDKHIRNSEQRLATGGGALIPEIANRLRSEGFEIVQDPLWANAYGLYLLAQKSLTDEVK